MHECPSSFNVTTLNRQSSKTNQFDWSEQLQGFILSASIIGKFAFQIPVGLLANVFSAKKILLIAIGANCILTFLTPICVFGISGAYVLILFRIIIGAAEGAVYPGFIKLLTTWIPVRERTRSMAFVSSGANVK